MRKRAMSEAERQQVLRSLDADSESPSWERRWAAWEDEVWHRAEERGELRDLPGKGRPLAFQDDPLSRQDERWLAHHVLRNAGCVPPWVETSRSLEAAQQRSSRCVEAWRHASVESARRACAAELERAWAAENKAIRAWNALAPDPSLQRYPMPLERRWQRLRSAFA